MAKGRHADIVQGRHMGLPLRQRFLKKVRYTQRNTQYAIRYTIYDIRYTVEKP